MLWHLGPAALLHAVRLPAMRAGGKRACNAPYARNHQCKNSVHYRRSGYNLKDDQQAKRLHASRVLGSRLRAYAPPLPSTAVSLRSLRCCCCRL